MKAIKFNLGWFVGLVIILVAGTALVVKAQQDTIQLAISPQVLDTQVNRGDVVTNDFRLTNGSDDTITINAIPKNFTPQGEDGAIDLTQDDTSYSLAKWISVEPKQVQIPANKTQDFKVTINVPDNAEPGSRFGSVVFATVPPESEGSGAVVSQEIAPVILVTVAGDLVESAEIADFYSVKNIWSNEPEAVLQARIKNNGNVHFQPTGSVVIKDTFGNEVTKVSLEQKNVLPDSIRKIDAKWPIDGFKIGRYSAELTVVYGDKDEIITSKTTFYIIPYQIILPIALVVIVVVFLVVKYRKRLRLALRVLSGKNVENTSKKDQE
jgi:hypothetical protein